MIKVGLDQLLLDPNNPRFVENLKIKTQVPDAKVEAAQREVLERFRTTADEKNDDDDESFFGIEDLIQSMRQIGFVPIDRVVVRRLGKKKGDEKYIVLEGNRRIAAAKYLRKYDAAETHPKKKLTKEVAKSLEGIEVLQLETDGLTETEIHDQVGVILGLRHYGSVLEWEPMPKAKNIYTEYMQAPPKVSKFALDTARVTGVAARLSVKRADVIKALKTYVAYEQLHEAFPVGPQPEHYSLLQAVVTNTKLFGSGYLSRDDTTFELASDSLEKVNEICQFEHRNSLDPDKKVLVDPKSVAPFASLVDKAHGHRDAATKGLAASLLDEVVTGQRTLDDATSNMISFEANRQWTDALEALLAKRDKALAFEDFVPSGNDLMRFEEAVKAFKNIRLIIKV
jgi:hypothetical protein